MDKLFTVEYYDNENQEQYIDVLFEAQVYMEDDSYDDEFGTVYFQPYPVLHDYPTWDKDEFTFSENWIIAIWLMGNNTYVDNQFTTQYMDDIEQDY